MSYCRQCMADITWSVLEGTEDDARPTKIPLDNHEETDKGPDRYRIKFHSTPPVVERIPETSPIIAQVDHRKICQQPRAI